MFALNFPFAKVHVKGVKLWPLIIIIFLKVRLREQGQHLITPQKETTLTSLIYYSYSSSKFIQNIREVRYDVQE